MEPFALSIPGYRRGISTSRGKHQHPHQQQYNEGNLDVDESRSPSPEQQQYYNNYNSGSRSRAPSHIINPLSHTPDTLRQLAVAGLSPEDELPSLTHPGFPHRPLPSSTTTSARKRRSIRAQAAAAARSGSNYGSGGVESDAGAGGVAGGIGGRIEQQIHKSTNSSKGHSARVRHLNTMTAIMHRCLRDGDMARAKRAMGLLLRTRDIDVRLDNLWVIGSEILMREGEGEQPSSSTLNSSISEGAGASTTTFDDLGADSSSQGPDLPSYTYGNRTALNDNDNDYDEEDAYEAEDGRSGRKKSKTQPPQRWGTAANFRRVKTYLELLIHQHPYDMHRPYLTSAVDFWPALFGIEVYNLDVEFRRAVWQIDMDYPAVSSPSSSRSSTPASEQEQDQDQDNSYDADRMDIDIDEEEEEEEHSSFTRLRSRRRSKEEEEEDEETKDRHNALDALRSEARRGALELAARMDEILNGAAPYSSHAEILRLRGHLSLFIADLFLPARLVSRYLRHRRRGGSQNLRSGKGNEKILRESARAPEEHVALARRREEQEKARGFFRRVLNFSSSSSNSAAAAGERESDRDYRGSGGGVSKRARLEDWVLKFLDPEDDE